MTNPELKTVPVTDLAEALRPFANAVFNDNGDVTYNFTAYSTDDLFRAYRLMKRYDALAASPPPPVAGDEGAIKRHADWPIDPDTGLRMLLDDAAPPPPPADMEAGAQRKALFHRIAKAASEKAAKNTTVAPQLLYAPILWTLEAQLPEILSAAHAAGKAEGEADLRGRIAVLEHWQRANQHRIGEAERQHREALDGLAAARAEALEEAKRDLPEPYRHPNGIFEDGWNAAAKEAHAAIRALISAPLPPREEGR